MVHRKTRRTQNDVQVIDKDVKTAEGSRNDCIAMFKPWPHQSSVSVLMLASILENRYDADAWCELYRYKSLWASTTLSLGVTRALH